MSLDNTSHGARRVGSVALRAADSAIFYTDEQQKETALTTIAEIEASGLWSGPV